MTAIDFSEVKDVDNVDKSGNIKCGKAMLQLVSVTEGEGDYGPYLNCNFEVLAHDEESEVGRALTQFINLSGQSAKGALQLSLALGTLKMEDIITAKANGMSIEHNIESAVGSIACGEITETKTKKLKVWDWYSTDAPEAADYPKPAKPDNSPAKKESKAVEEDDDVPF